MNTLTKTITQLYEMSKIDLVTRFKRRSAILNSGWRSIPSVSNFKIDLSPMNAILEKIGFERRLGNRLTFVPNQNKSMNRYMKYNMMRLEKLRYKKEDARKYWFLSWILMKRSISFRISAINKVYHNWYKNMPLSYIININKKVQKIYDKSLDDLEFKRAYIPKDEDLFIEVGGDQKKYNDKGGKWRPLGVPLAAWRITLHMWCNFLTFFLTPTISKRQHAFIPRKGTLTAWTSLVEKIPKYRYIYEIDLKGCFDNIQSEYVSHELEKLGVPPRYIYYLENLNRCTPKFKKEDMIDETQLRDKSMWKHLGKPEYAPPASMMDAWNEMEPENQAVVRAMLEPGQTIEEFIQEQWALWDSMANSPATLGTSHLGLPQGAATSPILTALVINEFTKQCEDSVFYADDGIFFSNSPIEIKDDPDKGIYLNKEKSHIIKENGVWKRDIKFLGLVYHHATDQLSAHTRYGSRLEFNRKAENIHEVLKQVKPKGWSQGMTKWERLFRSTMGGFVMSKLYNASWEQLEYVIKYLPTGVKGSWLDIKNGMDNYKTTSSSACHALSYVIKSGNSVRRPVNEKTYSPLSSTEPPKRQVMMVKGKDGKMRWVTKGKSKTP